MFIKTVLFLIFSPTPVFIVYVFIIAFIVLLVVVVVTTISITLSGVLLCCVYTPLANYILI